MAFCIQCGNEHAEDAKFCAHCGTAVGAASAENNQRKATYAGELHKCPNCGEVLDSFTAECPACGYELRGSKASGAIREFALHLGQTKSEEQKINLIRTFPIPNAKEDIFEFMILASSHFDAKNHAGAASTLHLAIVDAWLAKFEQSYQKANLMLQNDPDFPALQKLYDQGCAKVREEKKKLKTTQTHDKIAEIFAGVAKCMGFFCGIGVLIIAAFVEASPGGESSVHVLIGGIVLIISARSLGKRDARFVEFAIGALSGLLSFALAKYFENGMILTLIGGTVLIMVAVGYFKSHGKEKAQ